MIRAYVRTSRRTGVSMPLWLAALAAIAWVTVLFAVWLLMLLIVGAVQFARGARWAWERLADRH